LEEFSTKNSNIVFNFINPLENEDTRENNMQQLMQRGMTPMQLSVQESGKSVQDIIFPWALASYNNQTVIIPLVKNKIGETQQELVSNSEQHLEYAFADEFSKLTKPKDKKIAILNDNGELQDNYIAEYVNTLG